MNLHDYAARVEPGEAHPMQIRFLDSDPTNISDADLLCCYHSISTCCDSNYYCTHTSICARRLAASRALFFFAPSRPREAADNISNLI